MTLFVFVASELSSEVEDTIKCQWQPIVGDSFIVVVSIIKVWTINCDKDNFWY